MASARVEADPLCGVDDWASVALEKLLAKSGFARDGRPFHPGAEVDFELIAALAKCLADPDVKFPQRYWLGVRMGYRRRLPRTPAVYPRKSRWAAHVGTEVEIAEWAANYSSARHIEDKVNETFEEQERQGMMLRTTYREAKEIYRDRWRIAALAAVGPESDERVVHGGTHQVGVNPGIETPLHEDFSRHLGLGGGLLSVRLLRTRLRREQSPPSGTNRSGGLWPPGVLFGRGAGVHQGWRPSLSEHGGHLRDRFGFLSGTDSGR